MRTYNTKVSGDYKSLERLRRSCLGEEIRIIENKELKEDLFKLRIDTEGELNRPKFIDLLREFGYYLESPIIEQR